MTHQRFPRTRSRLGRVLAATVVALGLVVAIPEPSAALTTHQPTILVDEFDLGNSDVSLREAFFLAQQDADASVVQLAPGATYQLDCIGAGEGPLSHSPAGGPDPLRVEGNGATIEQTCPDHKVMSVSATLLELDQVIITGGDALSNGGGVAATGDVAVTDSAIVGNTDQHPSGNGGGGLLAQGDVTITGSILAGNEARTGGAVATITGGDITVTDSAIVDNTATSTISGLDTAGDLTITNSTVSRNTGGSAAAFSAGSTSLRHATVAGNTATSTSFASRAVYVLGDLEASYSVVAGNTVDAGSCFVSGTTTASAFSVEGDTSCGFTGQGDQQDVVDPRLGPARDNGGGMPTMFPLWGSPLVDAVPVAQCDGSLPTDQRGLARPFGDGCDIGAVEAVYPPHAFSDVPAWVEGAVRWITSDVNDPPIMTGYADGTFGPNQSITRAQVVRLLYREAGSPDTSGLPPHGLSDVPTWVEDAVRWAKADNIMTGYADGTFRPGNPITRAQVVRAKHRLSGEEDPGALPPHDFTDVPPWVEDAVRWAAGHELVTGYADDTFRPDLPITRAQVTRMDHRLAINPDAWDDPGTAPPTLPFVAPLP